MKKIIMISLLFISINSCSSKWTAIKKDSIQIHANMSFSVSDNWVKRYTDKEHYFITKDGFNLNAISILSYPLVRKLPKTNKKIEKGIDLISLSKLVESEFRETFSFLTVKSGETETYKIGQTEVIRFSAESSSSSNLKSLHTIIAFIYRKKLIIINYSGTKRYYFYKYQAVFKSLINSLKLI